MAHIYQTKLNKFLQDGARAAKFGLTGITDPFDTSKEHYLIIKTAQFPGKFHDVLDFKFKGRNIPIKGQTRYDNTWTCSFYLEESHNLRAMFMNWIEALDQQHNMCTITDKIESAQSKLSSNGYNSTIILVQYNFDDDTQPTAQYQLHNVFPKSVSSVDLDYSNVGNILEYTVEFSYSHFDFMYIDQSTGNIIETLKANFLGGISKAINGVKSNITSAIGKAIGSAKDSFTSSFDSNNISGTSLSSIGNSISSFGSKLYSESGSIFKGVDFNPANFIKV